MRSRVSASEKSKSIHQLSSMGFNLIGVIPDGKLHTMVKGRLMEGLGTIERGSESRGVDIIPIA